MKKLAFNEKQYVLKRVHLRKNETLNRSRPFLIYLIHRSARANILRINALPRAPARSSVAYTYTRVENKHMHTTHPTLARIMLGLLKHTVCIAQALLHNH